ncbi:hypothetical protein SBOR_2997 [Sclerotinia borealis F-4128]|uniref:Reverse transcriptase domain-containing protein n=1 Tax=Sclerotinia borealis (strain F-4128) TaxID=1432307 RepID=W9CQ54_SCLBF|nr:hypothetical protein SBOR_2997 [Sclerotinia borealis F-4128]
MDLVASFTHDVETALAAGKKVTIITMDVQDAFDALLKKRLLARITKQGWPKNLFLLINSFLTERKVRVWLEQVTTREHPITCKTPQGFSLSPVLYMLYLVELLSEDTSLRFGYVIECAGKARAVAKHIRGLVKVMQGPPVYAMRKAVTICVLPSLLYGTEACAHLGWHVTQIKKILTVATQRIIPAWKTTPVTALYHETGLPSAMAALKEAKLRFALRLQSINTIHLFTKRIESSIIVKRRDTGSRQRAKTKVQQFGLLIPPIPRSILESLWYTTDYRIDPMEGTDKKTAVKAFNIWWENLYTNQKIWMCIDSISVIWGMRANASMSLQWVFNNCYKAMKDNDIRVKWSPGHESIEGNEAANHFADLSAKKLSWDTGPVS